MVEGRQLPMFMTKQLGDNLKISKVVSKKKKMATGWDTPTSTG